jgi:hypothetical protein
MNDFFYRRRRGSTASELIDRLTHEGRAAGGSGAVPPGDGGGGLDENNNERPVSNAELSVLISVDNTLAKRDRRRGRALARRQKALVAAAHANVGAAADLEAAQAEPRWVNGGIRTGEKDPALAVGLNQADGPSVRRSPLGRARRGSRGDSRPFKEMFDPHEPLITGRALLIIEIVFIFVEFAFWYGVFSANLDQGTSLLAPDRISDVLLAVMIPLSGIVSARVVGGLAHRAISRHPGVGRKEYIGAAASAIVAGLAVFAIFSLVSARFDAATQLTATRLPTLAMTLVFVVVLLGDMLARIFLVSEIRSQTSAWLRRLRKLRTAAIRANEQHCAAWIDLRNAAQMELDNVERVVASGARIISDQRSRRNAVAPRVPAGDETARRHAHDETAVGGRGGPMSVPSVVPLQLYGVHLALGPIRAVGDAISTLRAYPPLGQDGLVKQVSEVLVRLYRLEAAMTSWAVDAAGRPAVSDVDSPGPGAAGAGENGLESEHGGAGERAANLGDHLKPLPETTAEPPARLIDEVNGIDPTDGRAADQDGGDQR